MSNQKEKTQERTRRVKAMLRVLKKLFPNAGMALNYGNDWELLVAVVLSAQCTDKMVNRVTEKLFKKYPNLSDYVDADPQVFEQDIRSTGFYRNKTKSILAAARIIHETFHGKLPATMADMLKIPGVARKTANVVLGNAHGVVEGIAVDTHVRRLCLKFDLTDSTDPKKIEHDLMRMVPKIDWFLLTYLFIEYGREICPARKHDCASHPLTKLYPPAASRWPKAK
jgi:endonuclease-3